MQCGYSAGFKSLEVHQCSLNVRRVGSELTLLNLECGEIPTGSAILIMGMHVTKWTRNTCNVSVRGSIPLVSTSSSHKAIMAPNLIAGEIVFMV